MLFFPLSLFVFWDDGDNGDDDNDDHHYYQQLNCEPENGQYGHWWKFAGIQFLFFRKFSQQIWWINSKVKEY